MSSIVVKPAGPSLRERFEEVLSIDAETIGLYGDHYAAGWARFSKGKLVASGGVAARCIVEGDLDKGGEGFRGSLPGWDWVRKNPPPKSARLELVNNRAELLAAFSRQVRGHKAKGLVVAADVPSPVEAGLMIECERLGLLGFDDSPYPLYDIASIMACAALDPTAHYPRNAIEQPPHCPVADAIQSGRLLFEAIDLLESRQ